MICLKGIKFPGYLISRWEKNTFCGYLISCFGDCKTFHAYLIFDFSKNKKRKSYQISTFLLLINVIVIKCATENSNFVNISRDMRYASINIIF